MKKISVVIPVYNEEHIIEELITRLQKATDPLAYQFEFVIVDDGSQDGTLDRLLSIQHGGESRLKIIKLSRNWGHQNAFNAGLDHAEGNAVILMDGDLEDPPELIPELVKKWEGGFDVIYTVKESRQESRLKKALFSLFYIMMSHISDITVDRQAGMFSLVDEKAVAELRRCNERNKYYVGLRDFIGFAQTSVSYRRDKRFSGKPKQTFKRLFNYALNAFFSFSFLPIRFLTFFGFLIVVVISVLTVILILLKLGAFGALVTIDPPGWTSMVLVMFFILGVQIIFMGILGEYVARIFDEVRSRPYYIVENIYTAGCPEKNSGIGTICEEP
jgi:polyisoprenyl-phosphate glycosyltransferase